MFIDPNSFDAFVVYSKTKEIRYFSGTAEIAEAWFKIVYPNESILKIVSDVEYNSYMWGKI